MVNKDVRPELFELGLNQISNWSVWSGKGQPGEGERREEGANKSRGEKTGSGEALLYAWITILEDVINTDGGGEIPVVHAVAKVLESAEEEYPASSYRG